MPNYKKKKHSRISQPSKPKRVKNTEKIGFDDDIKMTPVKSRKKTQPQHSMKVVKGKKFEQARKFKVITITLLILALIFTGLHFALPMGVSEGIGNAISLFGAGGYPIELGSTQTVNAVSRGTYYYVLSNTGVEAFSNTGKNLFSYTHGFENPVIKTSASRALVFDQGGNQILIFTHSGLKESLSFEEDIITANISDSGAYAVVTESEKYTAAVTVFAKNGQKQYEWFSAENVVNNVVLSANGKKMAVSSFSSKNGQFQSQLNVLNYKSATPEYTENFENGIVYNLDSTYRSGFMVLTANKVKFIKWHKFKSTEYSSDYNSSVFRTGKNGFVVVFNRESDKTDNRIAVFSKFGKIKYELQYKGIISDIAVFGSHIYCMEDSNISLLGSDGEVLRNADCGFGAVRMVATATNTCAVITDNKIEKIKLE